MPTHHASADFWPLYLGLRPVVRARADKAFALLKANPSHPSLHFKRVGPYWSARVDLHHRALAVPIDDGLLWFWIGTHGEYERLIG